MPIKEAEKSYEHKKIEKEVQEVWIKNQVYSKTNQLREEGPKYSFLDGPPYCSGKIHLGTAWNKIIKDTYLRFKSMKGFSLRRQAGWDTHGLPIEHKVEQLLNIKNKQQIEEEIGIANFVSKCKEFALKNKDAMTSQFEDLGVWMDWDDPYVTFDPKYMESCWWTLKKAHEKDLLLKDKRVISWCPRCETALAAAEIDYEDKIDPSIYVKFPSTEPILNKADNPDVLKEYFLVWTTTPWTLPANLAICMNPDFDYSFVKFLNEKKGDEISNDLILNNEGILILASDLVETIFGPAVKITKVKKDTGEVDENGKPIKEIEEIREPIYEVIKIVKGSDLEGLSYVYPLLDEIPEQKKFDEDNEDKYSSNVHTILPGGHVELGEGTGLVHTAPGHGPDDFEIGKQFNLPIFCPVDEEGNFTQFGGKYFGEFVKDANPNIINDLKMKNLLFKEETIEHRYGTCWRCKTPIIYLATEQWFLKITEIKDKMLSEIEKVEWVPKWAGEGRFHDWVDNAKDWTISRQRYWGIPIPVWVCEDCGNIKVIGSVKELKDNSINEIKANDEDLVHRPYVDEIIIKCDSLECDCNSNDKTGSDDLNNICNGEMRRIPDVLDVWIDSGVAGWASLYYPQKKDMFDEWFPYDFITEGHDQTRGWFYSQLGTGVIAFDQIPYKKVLMHGFVLDEMGKKMSKSLGNVVQPEDVIEDYGADVLRFYLLWASKPWDDLKFVWDELNNIKKMFNILWNVYVFSTTYMSLDNFNPENCDLNDENSVVLRDEDKWIISKANSLLRDVEEDLGNAFFHQATRKINSFILEDLSRWYVRLIRGRTWVEKDDPDKLGAYYGLYTAIELLIKVLAPIAPHISENIYENLVKGTKSDGKLSIHMEDWKHDENLIDVDLENQMDIVREIIEASARARDVAKYKLRWPVNDITVVSDDDFVLEAVNNLESVIKDQSNTKEVITSKEFENVKYIAKPNLKTLGPRLRQDMGFVKKYLAENDGNKIKSELEANGKINVSIFNNEKDSNNEKQENIKIIELSVEDVLFDNELPEDIVSSDFDGGNVFVNTQITPEILSEAMARELIRRIQDMRKDMDLDVEANINVAVDADEDFRTMIASQIHFISNEVRANNILFENIHETSINDNDNKDNKDKKQYIKEWKIENENIILKIEV
ncbi:isoleucine--tRNA ligase [Methanobrevibacter arboriphilus]|uniref:Isoleucine--tRNA ligase n=1 Tax=Methanobrevibacter arboriphilus TaxID=39441 RepID=A0ACA8R4Q3_METAZ|nr:isoleucine--tRNA ligase [Methanobrevibacter arboriphilus]BBL62237.1 isoleucine--tRNA ligase [Methanobrevibacter arboriphilus]